MQGAPQSESESVAQVARDTENRAADTTYLLPLSARSEPALKALARSYRDFLNAPESTASLYDICYAASARRSHHEYRLAATGNSAAQLADALDAFIAGETRPGLSSGRKLSDRQRKLVFVFPGQGSQWFGMGRELLKTEPVFRDAIERCDRAMRPYGDWSILKELEAADASRSRLGEIDVLQPALFAIQVALAALWRSWGIEPHAVVGHSMGEVAAAHVAGALSLDDAVRVICTRSRLVKPTIGRGAMAAVDLSIADAQRAIAGYEDRVSIAVSNGPTSTVLSGDPAALETIVARLQSRDIFGRMIKVDFAAHSPDMEPLRADLKRALEGIQPQHPSIPLYSTVTGRDAEDLALDPDYWSRNLREPVLFSSAVEQLLTGGHDIFLEISPHPILLSAIQQEFRHTGLEGAAIPSLRRDEQENKVLTSSLGALYTTGYPIEWNRIYSIAGQPIQLPDLPMAARTILDGSAGGCHARSWRRQAFAPRPPFQIRAIGDSLLGRHPRLHPALPRRPPHRRRRRAARRGLPRDGLRRCRRSIPVAFVHAQGRKPPESAVHRRRRNARDPTSPLAERRRHLQHSHLLPRQRKRIVDAARHRNAMRRRKASHRTRISARISGAAQNSMHRTDLGRGPLPETRRSRRHLWPLLPDHRGPVAMRQRNNRRAESPR